MKRNHILDSCRGFTVISMVFFHLLYDVNLFRVISWYENPLVNSIWQISIAASFFIISGITSSLLDRRKNIKRGIILNIIGLIITLITYFFARDIMIVFGVMNGLGICMIITGLIQEKIKDLNSIIWPGLMLLLYTSTYSIQSGAMLFGKIKLPVKLYNLNLFPLGLPSSSFISEDYFGLIPWIFIYLFGFFIGRKLIENKFYGKYGKDNILSEIGKRSLTIYILHQPILYLLVILIFEKI